MSIGRHLLVFVLALLVSALVLLPAGQAVRWLQPSLVPFELHHSQGTIWSGQAELLSIGGVAFGPVDWRVLPLDLLQGQWKIHIQVRQQGIVVDGYLGIESPDQLNVELHKFRMPMAMLARLIGLGAHQPQGVVSFDGGRLDWQAGVLRKVDGALMWQGAALRLPEYLELGDLQGQTSMREESIVVTVETTEEAIISGQVNWSKSGRISFEGLIDTQGAPPSWASKLPVIDAKNRAQARFQGHWYNQESNN